jgi:hypothetical protein
MEFYNLLGQKGPKGETNPNAPEAGPYIYDKPPGRGDNKGVIQTSFGILGVRDLATHNKKLEEAGLEPLSSGDLSMTSFGPREEVEAKAVKPPATFSEIDNVNSLADIAQLAARKTISDTQKNSLIGLFGFSREEVDNAIAGAIGVLNETELPSPAGDIDFNKQLQEEDTFIRNIVNNNIAIAKAQEETRDTRTLIDKETEYIQNYVESIIGPADPADINYNEQLQNEMVIIKNFVDTVVVPKIEKKVKLENKNVETVVDEIIDETKTTTTPTTTPTTTGAGAPAVPPPGGIQLVDLNNIPRDAYVWNVDNQLYVAYEVPGAGDVYEQPPIYMAYEVYRNDLVEAGIWTKGETLPPISPIRKEDFDRVAILFSGDTNQLTQDNRNPFAAFTETITEQSQVAPWITDSEVIGLIAEAALEGREVTDAEWQTTNWYQTHNESEREWLRTYYSDPSTATQLTTDAQIAVANSLQAAGVSNAPEALINWVAGKFVSGEWSQTYTTEQISLFADPYATGKRDESFENYLSSTALTGVDRTTEREREVRELYSKWLGPTLGKLTDQETAEIAGRLRDDPDYQDQLVQSLKQSRLAAFSNYTNPELTYEDIARPWRNLTTSVWGQTADETQGWWQEMVKSNDFATAQTTLREKGLEQDITQVTQDATQALQQALGQGTVSQSGVNV